MLSRWSPLAWLLTSWAGVFAWSSLVAPQALASPVDLCEVLIACKGTNPAECRARFEAAEAISRVGTGAELPDGGRRLDIPEALMDGLTKAFQSDYINASITEGASPAAKKNVGHMEDHFAFIERHAEKFEALGIDLPSLKLAMAAHDIGKGFLDSAIAAYIRENGQGREQDLNPFLRDFILSHELHSIAGIPRVVTAHLESVGIDTQSVDGKQAVVAYSKQIMEAIRLHNGVDVTGDLRTKYPSLSPQEISTVQNAWWPANYRKFAEVMGIEQTAYGGKTTPLGDALNFIDRTTLTSPSGFPKLMAESLGRMNWGLELIEASSSGPALGNQALIKASGDRLLAVAKTESQRAPVRELVNASQKFNDNMIAIGQRFRGFKSRAEAEGIPVAENTVVMQRANGQWIRINGANKSSAFIEVWTASGFRPESSPTGRSPVELLLQELR